MTRRRIVFLDKKSQTYYITGEFNGDKEEFLKFNMGDTCNMNWNDIITIYFSNIKTLEDFKIANEKAQQEYKSNLINESKIIPIEKINNINTYINTYGSNLYFV